MTTATVSAALAKRETGPTALMWARRSHFRTVLPASVDVEAFLGTAAGALYASDIPGKSLTLMKCAQQNPDSLIVALMECAALGHMPGTDEYYLTPRMDHGRPKVLGIEGYRGVIERMYRSGAVAKVVVREVCARDYFDYVEGEMDKPVHKMAENHQRTGAGFFGANGGQDRGEMVGAYAYAQLTTGAISRVVLLTRDDVFAARDAGGYKPDDKFSPWNRMDGGESHPEFVGRSMWWKTAAKRLEPWVPTSAEYRREQLRAAASAAASTPAPPAPYVPAPDDTEPVEGEIVDERVPADGPEKPARRQRVRNGEQVVAGKGREALAGMVVQHFERLGVTDRDERLIMTTRLAQRPEPLESTKDLDAGEQQAVLDTLSRCKDRGALVALLASGDAPEGGAADE